MACTAASQVSEPPGKVIKPNSWKSIQDEGMPVHGRPYREGQPVHPLQGGLPRGAVAGASGTPCAPSCPAPSQAPARTAAWTSMQSRSVPVPSGRLSRFLSKGAGAVRRAVQSPRISMDCGPMLSRSVPERSLRISFACICNPIHGEDALLCSAVVKE